MKKSWFFLVLVVAIALSGCFGTASPEIVSIRLTPESAQLEVNNELKLKVYGVDAKGETVVIDDTVEWIVEGDIGTIESSGNTAVFVAAAEGTGTIQVVVGKLMAEAEITVRPSSWGLYDGTVLPSEAEPQWRDVRGDSYLPSIVADDQAYGGKALAFNELDKSKRSVWGLDFGADLDLSQGLTVVWRAKPIESVTADVISEVRIHNGYRTIVRVEPSRIRVDGFDSLLFEETQYDPNDWLIIRVVLVDDYLELYINEESEPAIAGQLSKSQSGNELWFGEDSQGNRNIAGMIDWMAWNLTGAYAPDELQLPVR